VAGTYHIYLVPRVAAPRAALVSGQHLLVSGGHCQLEVRRAQWPDNRDGDRIVAPNLQGAHGIGGDDCGQPRIANSQLHLRDQAIQAHFLDVAA